jgi:hypothetical protein
VARSVAVRSAVARSAVARSVAVRLVLLLAVQEVFPDREATAPLVTLASRSVEDVRSVSR